MKLNAKVSALVLFILAGCATQPKEADLSSLKTKAASGDAVAMFKLGTAYDYGVGTSINRVEAAKWYLKSAELGNAEAQNSLGSMYQAGEGVEKDPNKALFWYQKAAQSGHAEATNNIAYLYDSGLLGKVDKKKAIQLYNQAAAKGHIPSLFNLGLSYLNGDGVPMNKVEAYKWFDLARLYTQDTYPTDSKEHRLKWQSRGYLDKLKQELTPQQVKQAESMGNAWNESLKK